MSRLSKSEPLGFMDKLRRMNWGLVLLIIVIGTVGVALLYSAGGKNWHPWAGAQFARFLVGLCLMLGLAFIDVRFWLRSAYILYGIMLVLLVVVEVMGHIGMGAQRWINFGFFVLQPSELMKITLVLALARYFHGLELSEIARPTRLIPALLMILAPVGLVLLQPNLGTALLLLAASGAIFLVAGVRPWKFILVILLVLAAAPIVWSNMHDYQKNRVMTFLEPDQDPRGTGYNIIQSKIALGSGGIFGKGFGQGSQSQLQFLPEKHTDFIFVVLAEEFGIAGAIGLLLLYFLLNFYGLIIAVSCQNQFARLAAFGLTISFFLYVFVNVAMVTGTIPVVGIPLPLISYGGTAMLTLLIGCGILLGLSIHKDVRISRTGISDS